MRCIWGNKFTIFFYVYPISRESKWAILPMRLAHGETWSTFVFIVNPHDVFQDIEYSYHDSLGVCLIA